MLWLILKKEIAFSVEVAIAFGARFKNAIAEEIRSQAFISKLLMENAIAFSDGFSVSVLKRHGSRRWKQSL
jgi:formylmethanofuran dehydrogenase subunit C